MKRNLTLIVAFLLLGATTFGQAVKDRNIIPVAVNLNQVLRMTITNGGNIEFVFNTIDEYKDGISGNIATGGANLAASEPLYKTDFTVASSTRWKITYGSEQATFMGTDNPGNTLALDNVGYSIEESGAHNFETGVAQGSTAGEELWSIPTNSAAEVAALQPYPVVLIEDNNSATNSNAGDASDNIFTLVWRCGTSESTGLTTPMNQVSLIEQSATNPDRYVTNVLFELSTDNI